MTILVGQPERFAIEAEPELPAGDWIYGRFRFWLGGLPVGNWEDSADLKGCVSWLREFATVLRDRYEPRLWNLAPAEVFGLVFDPVMGPTGIANPAKQPIPHAFSRFHISHLGMSSFDKFDLVLLKDEEGAERCLWRNAEAPGIHECRLSRNEMEDVAEKFCRRFELDVLQVSPNRT
jgi:hypothetical protein